MNEYHRDAVRQLLCARQIVLEKAIEFLQRNDADAEKLTAFPTTAGHQLDSIGNEIAGELLMLRASLIRFDDGTFGHCAACPEEISDVRLDAYPYAMLCEACAAQTGGESAEYDYLNRVDEKIAEWLPSLRSA